MTAGLAAALRWRKSVHKRSHYVRAQRNRLNLLHLKAKLVIMKLIPRKLFVTGIKFLWWTWHDTDAPIDYRILGVPIGSTVWVITFTGE